jgi:hypothetical protein
MGGAENRTHSTVSDQLFEAIFSIDDDGQNIIRTRRRLIE